MANKRKGSRGVSGPGGGNHWRTSSGSVVKQSSKPQSAKTHFSLFMGSKKNNKGWTPV